MFSGKELLSTDAVHATDFPFEWRCGGLPNSARPITMTVGRPPANAEAAAFGILPRFRPYPSVLAHREVNSPGSPEKQGVWSLNFIRCVILDRSPTAPRGPNPRFE